MDQLLRQVVLIVVVRQFTRLILRGRINLLQLSRNIALLLLSFAVSVLIGWWLIEEEQRLRQRSEGTQHEEMQPDAADDLTLIDGIGERYARALNELGITSFAQLARQDPAELSQRMNSRVSAERIRNQDWIGQARQYSRR
jgi:hypothetical protein